jgi:predicted transcriptional regulator
MTEQRNSIHRAIIDVPGIHFNGLVRRLDLAPGQVQYHLRKLRREGRVVRQSLYGRTHYYPTEYDSSAQRTLALCHRETARDILLYLLEAGPSNPASVVDSLDIARGTLEWHLDHLVEQNLVQKRRNQNRVELSLVRPEETVRLLSQIKPTFSDRLFDRFTRLVDQLLTD